MERPPDRRTGAVGADQQIALGGLTVREPQRNATARQGEPAGLVAERDRVDADLVEERAVQCRPQRHHRRTAQNVGRRELRALEDSAVQPAEFAAGGCETAPEHDVGDAERAQGGDGVRGDEEAKAELTGRGRALEDADGPPGLPQREAGRQPADPGADDERGARRGHQPRPRWIRAKSATAEASVSANAARFAALSRTPGKCVSICSPGMAVVCRLVL